MVALAFTRWQFARRCKEQYEELSRILREPAVLTGGTTGAEGGGDSGSSSSGASAGMAPTMQ
jgi:hypothetical protein